jgi:2-polyprenyl-6-hydroxyphenyl methylase/3-demethylubiquinone-9 3-methyltransferase
MGYFHDVLARRGVGGGRALDIGCGAGFITEELASAGFTATGIDPSEVAVQAARAHAEGMGLAIDYLVGAGEQLPFDDATFDLVTCCDVLEHVRDPDQVIAETARVLRPGGLYLFDTINRTRRSRLIAIRMMQEWRLTRIIDTSIHEWSMFITPTELGATLDRRGLELGEVTGLAPRARPTAIVGALRAVRRGRIGYGELSRRLDFGRVESLALSYMGYAVRR